MQFSDAISDDIIQKSIPIFSDSMGSQYGSICSLKALAIASLPQLTWSFV